MRVGIVVFPGSNCDHDAYHVVHAVLGHPAQLLWHKDRDLKGVDAVILPGGFSFGDYLRCGAIARFSPVMEEVVKFAHEGRPVLGICNGFQILTESHLLPGALMPNAARKFICSDTWLRVDNAQTGFTKGYQAGEKIRLPIAHMEGNYFIDDAGLERLEGEGRVVFRYLGNPNGARADIAGIVNEKGNVLGMMPHPERASEAVLGSVDGLRVFQSFLGSV